MTMGPEPRMRIFEMSVLRGIRFQFSVVSSQLRHACFVPFRSEIELGGLSDDNGSGAEDEDFRDVSSAWHSFSVLSCQFSVAARVLRAIPIPMLAQSVEQFAIPRAIVLHFKGCDCGPKAGHRANGNVATFAQVASQLAIRI